MISDLYLIGDALLVVVEGVGEHLERIHALRLVQLNGYGRSTVGQGYGIDRLLTIIDTKVRASIYSKRM